MIIVTGELEFKPGTIAKHKSAMETVLQASRAEPGCHCYTYAVDVENDCIMRIFEIWESEAHLLAHRETPHIKTWRASSAQADVVRRDLTRYKVAGELKS